MRHVEVSGRVFEMKDKKGDKTLKKTSKIRKEEDPSKKKTTCFFFEDSENQGKNIFKREK